MQVSAIDLSEDRLDDGTGTSIMNKLLPEGIDNFVANGGKTVESGDDSD